MILPCRDPVTAEQILFSGPVGAKLSRHNTARCAEKSNESIIQFCTSGGEFVMRRDCLQSGPICHSDLSLDISERQTR